MSVDEVRHFFIKRGLNDPVFNLNESGATVELASKTIGVEPGAIAKTLAFQLKSKDILVVTRGDAKVDNKKYKGYFKVKAKMLNHDEVEKITGHPVGGVCPFGLANELEIYLDISLKEFQYVYPAAGSNLTAMKISPDEIAQLTNGTWVDLCKESLNG